MSETMTTPVAEPAAEAHDQDHVRDLIYVKVAVVLAVLTGLETSTYWVDLGSAHTPLLLIMMVLKFALVIMYFMHLKFDSRMFGVMFYVGLLLTLTTMGGAILTFAIF